MPERFPIGADVVEAAKRKRETAHMFANSEAQCMEAAIREALDKLGLREELGTDWSQPPHVVSIHRYVSAWRQVDAEPAMDRRSGRHRRSEANSPRSEMAPQRRSGNGRRREDAQSGITHVRVDRYVGPSATSERITHGRHCICSACAAQDWAEPGLAPCGMHGPSCPPVYVPLGAAGDVQRPSATSEGEPRG